LTRPSFDNFAHNILGLFTGQTTVDSILGQMDKDWEMGRS
jgi:hypothetical protein